VSRIVVALGGNGLFRRGVRAEAASRQGNLQAAAALLATLGAGTAGAEVSR